MAIAIKEILYNNKQYYPGDELPDDGPVKEWVNAGSAVEKVEPVKRTRAKRASATAGLPGIAIPPSGEDLVGKVPRHDV